VTGSDVPKPADPVTILIGNDAGKLTTLVLAYMDRIAFISIDDMT
jgi:hypothetical protein